MNHEQMTTKSLDLKPNFTKDSIFKNSHFLKEQFERGATIDDYVQQQDVAVRDTLSNNDTLD